MITSLRIVLALIALTHLVTAQTAFRDELHGIAFELPDDTWIHEVKPRTAEGGFVVQAGPPSMGGQVYGQVTATVASPTPGPEALRDYIVGTLGDRSKYSEPLLVDDTIDDMPAPGVVVELEVAGVGPMRVRQHYVVAHETRFVVETLTPVEDHARWEDQLERWIQSVTFIPPSADAVAVRSLIEVAAGVDDAIPWETSWDDAARRARTEGKLVLVRVYRMGGFDLPDGAILDLAIDGDLQALIEERFVPMRWTPGLVAPFIDAENYGLGERAFGSTFLVLTPDGRVLHEGEPLLGDVLREACALHAAPPLAADADLTRAERADLHARRGEFDAARALLDNPDDAHEHVVLASIARRERDGDTALAHLAQARKATGITSVRARVDLEAARVASALGHIDEAARRYAALEVTSPSDAPEALLGLAACLSALEDATGAEATWRHLAAEHPTSPHGAVAAAILTHPAFEFIGPFDLTWPDAELTRLVERRERAPLGAATADRARSDARTYLLDTQRDNGAWLTAAQVTSGADSRDEIVDATTALAARALLAEREAPGTREAVERALAWLSRSLDEHLADSGDSPYMDYAVWSRCCLLLALADAIDAGVGEADAHRAAMRKALDDLVARQQPTGGWTYFLSGSATGEPVSQSISFVTAFVLKTLERTAELGLTAPAVTVQRGTDALAAMRSADVRYAYMLMDGGVTSPPVSEAGSAARAPLCTHALMESGRTSLEDLRDGLDVYAAHIAPLNHEAGKRIMHAGPDGLGAHYVLFDHLMSAEALAPLDAGERRRWRSTILDALLAVRRDDGSFVDLPQLGPATGTSLALLALQTLAE